MSIWGTTLFCFYSLFMKNKIVNLHNKVAHYNYVVFSDKVANEFCLRFSVGIQAK